MKHRRPTQTKLIYGQLGKISKDFSSTLATADLALKKISALEKKLFRLDEQLTNIQRKEAFTFMRKNLRLLLGKPAISLLSHPDFESIFWDNLKRAQVSLTSFLHGQKDLQARVQQKDLPLKVSKLKIKPTLNRARNQNSKMLFISEMFCSSQHGGGQRIQDFVNYFSKQNTIDYYSLYHPEIDTQSLAKMRSKFRNCRLVYGSTLKPGDLSEWLKGNRCTPKQYDIVHLEYPSSVELLDTIRPFAKKIVFTMMECLTLHHLKNLREQLQLQELSKKTVWIVYQLLQAAAHEAKGLQESDLAIAVTDQDRNFAFKYFGIYCQVIPTGISEDLFKKWTTPTKKNREKSKALSTVFVGFYNHDPNVYAVDWYLKNIHPQLKRRFPSYKFYIVGGGNSAFLESMKRLASKDSSVVPLGFVKDLRRAIGDKTVCVAPIFTGAGIRGKIHQYAALERPMVTSELAVTGTLYRKENAAVVTNDKNKFVKSIARIFQDKAFAHELGKNAFRVVSAHYVSDKISAKLEKLYAS